MKRLACLALPTLLLSACSYLGQPATGPGHYGAQAHHAGYGQYGAQTHAGAHAGAMAHGYAHHGSYASYTPSPAPVVNPCALGGPCGPAGGYSTVPHGQQAQIPAAHAYGSHHGAPYSLRGPSNPYRKASGQNSPYAYGTIGAQLFDVDDDLFGIQGRLGYQTANILGAELEGSYGLNSDTETIEGIEVEGKVESQIAGFATARFPITDRFALRGRGGYHFTEAKVTASADGLSSIDRSNIDGFAWGGGAEMFLTPRDAIRADYTRYHAGSGGDALDSVSLAYLRRF